MGWNFAAVLFDMDGVIVDNMPLHRAVWAEFARSYGLSPSEAELRKLDGRRAVDIIRAFFGDLDEAEVARRAKARETLYRERLGESPLHAVPGVRNYLAALEAAGIPRVLATSATPDNAATVLSRLKLENHFSARVTSVDVQRGKPDPQVYCIAAARANVSPEACLVVEDALPGVQAAKAAGARCLGLTTSESAERLREAGADWLADSFEQLPDGLRPPGTPA
ncbi:MAG TPA: HAD family phosphatase [Oscillatoriaceae cyanobacterium]